MAGQYYTKLEYLEGTGIQYLDTGVKTGSGVQEFILETEIAWSTISGTRQLSGADNSQWIGVINGQWEIVSSRGPYYEKNKFYKVKNIVRIEQGKRYTRVYIDDVLGIEAITQTNVIADNQQLVFNIPGYNYYCSCKMKYWRLTRDGVVICDLMPVLDNNKRPAMYDKVSKTLKYNLGSGEFLYGTFSISEKKNLLRKKLQLALATSKKKRKYYCEVEYLKSDGIDLMYITPDLNYFPDFEIGVKCDENTDKNCTLGTDADNLFERNNATNPYWRLKASGTSFMSNVEVSTYADAKYKDGVFSVNGTVVGNKANAFPSGTLYLFRAPSGTSGYKMSIYFFKAWDSNGNLIRDMIPVLDWNYTPCMYDKITDTLFYNAGVGTFTVGREIHTVEYLESTGTQYIDTGIIPNEFTKSFLDYQITEYVGSGTIYGAHSGLDYTQYNYYAETQLPLGDPQNNFRSVLGDTSEQYNWTSDEMTTRHQILLNDDKKLYIDEQLVYTFSSFNTIPTNTIYLFWASGLPSDSFRSPGKIYSCKIWDSNVLVRDYKPAIDENGIGYMFDFITHRIYNNIGTGLFKYPAKELEYLESTGTQYIETGINGSNQLKIGVVCEAKSEDKAIIGCGSGPTATDRLQIFADITYYSCRLDGIRAMSAIPTLSKAKIILDIPNKKYTINNEDISIDYTDSLSNRELYLFGRNIPSDFANYNFIGKIYHNWIKSNGSLIRDYIPAFKNGIAGMLDRVNNIFYSNSGTGNFNYGHIKEDKYE